MPVSIDSEFRLFLGAAASAGSAGILSLIAAPVLVSGLLAGLNVAEDTAGSITSAELITVALVSILIAPKMGLWPRRNIAMVGACIAVIGHCFSMFISDIYGLIIIRVFAGAGAGLMVAAGNASVAAAKDPDRIYSLIVLITGITQLIVISIGPILVEHWSYAAGYGMEMVFVMAMLPLIALLPKQVVNKSQPTEKELEVASLPIIIALCLMIALYFSRDSSLWGFSQEIGVRVGLSKDHVGFILGMTGITAILGAATAAFLSTRWGRFKPLLFGLVTNTVLALWISQTNSAWVFTILEFIYHYVLFFTVPYMYGLAAAIDPKGRALAAAGGSMLIGAAAGPVIGGHLITWGGYPALGGFIVIAMTLALGIALFLIRELT